jgi:hypothetical protein
MSFQQWEAATHKISFFKQSSELKNLTNVYKTLSMRATPTARKNLGIAYKSWTDCSVYNVEKATIGAVAENALKTEATGDTVVSNMRANTITRGYTLYVPGDAQYKLDGDVLLPMVQRAPPLTSPQIQIINEALQRSKLAAEMARDAMIIISKNTALALPYTRNEILFVNYLASMIK